ncbi:MAG: alpha/beta hydrolase [Streptosporangiales bacterium]|nr:alpha/beta hydrolase [Streptosporangiales bacterium]
MSLDKATADLLEQMAALGDPPLHEQTPEQAREIGAARREQAPPGPLVAVVRDTTVPVEGGDIPVRILTPKVPGDRSRGVIVWYHGGGWVLGGLDEADPVGRNLAQRTGYTVVMVDYRLAPEYRYPVAVDDSWAALNWAAERLPELIEVVPSDTPPPDDSSIPLLVAGDSAGGNLAAVMAQRARAAGGPALAAQVLVYPVTDCDLDTLSYTDPENQALLTREGMIWFWDHYVPAPEQRLQPGASPLRAPDLAGLPPAVVLTAEHDPLRDEGEVYADRLLRAGVPVRRLRAEGQMHGFYTMPGILPGADAGLDFVASSLEEFLPAPPGDGEPEGSEAVA